MNNARTVPQSLQQYARGIAGGLIFSLPLLYTMEMWWAGLSLSPLRLLCGLIATFILLLGYNSYAGIRHDTNFWEVAVDSVEELGIGLVLSAAVLALLGRISAESSFEEVVGKIVVETLAVAIGVSVGTTQLGTQEKNEEGSGSDESGAPEFGSQVVIAACGATLFATNVAPTEEITMLAVEMAWPNLLLMVVASLGLAVMILFFSDFRSSRQIAPAENSWSIVRGTIVTYSVALAMSAAILWFFGRFDNASTSEIIAHIVVLGFAASLGSSAGRLLLQSQ